MSPRRKSGKPDLNRSGSCQEETKETPDTNHPKCTSTYLVTYCEVTLAILDFFGKKALDMSEELNIEGLGVGQFLMRGQLKKWNSSASMT